MPESLFAPRRAHRHRLVHCAIAAVLLESSLIGIAQIWPQNQTMPASTATTDIDDFSPWDEPPSPPPPDDPPSPPDAPPTPPEPDPEVPPPDDAPEMILDTPWPKYVPNPNKPPGLVRPTISPARHGKKTGFPPVIVPGGNSGVPVSSGSPAIKAGGTWHVSVKPPYPAQARASHAGGSGTIRLSTDATGKVISATIDQSSGNPLLDHVIAGHAKLNWSGPPNETITIPFTFQLR